MRKRVCYKVKDIKARRTSDREDMREILIRMSRAITQLEKELDELVTKYKNELINKFQREKK